MRKLDEIQSLTQGFHYLASPYSIGGCASDDVMQENYNRAVAASARLASMGLLVFSPVVHWHDVGSILPKQAPSWWLERCFVFLRDAESMWVLTGTGWGISPGVQEEIKFAESRAIPITYFGLKP